MLSAIAPSAKVRRLPPRSVGALFRGEHDGFFAATIPRGSLAIEISYQISYQSEQIWGDLLDLIWLHKATYACPHLYRSCS